MKNDNAIAVQSTAATGGNLATIMTTGPQWDTICKVGAALAESGFLGQGVNRNGGVAAAMVMAKQGLDPVEFKQKYHIINNNPSRTVNSLLGDYRKAGGKYIINENSDDRCSITFCFEGNEVTISITLEEMIKKGIAVSGSGKVKDNWAKFPDDMLFARVCAKGLRRIAPELMGGVYVDREVEDFAVDQRKVTRFAPPPPPAPDPASAPAEDDITDIEEIISEPFQPDADDCGSCPIAGSFRGVRYDEMDVDVLTALLNPSVRDAHPELTDAHIANIAAALKAKEDKEVENV